MEIDLRDYDRTLDLADAKTLPSLWYSSPEILAQEKLKIFARTWQQVARLDQFAETGNYLAIDWLDEPLLITRDNEEKIRAMSNVCRHRAGRLLNGEGRAASLRCPYHSWTYSLGGELVSQPEFDGVRGFEKEKVCLPQFDIESLGPCAFVKTSSHGPGFSQMMGNIAHEAREKGYDLDDYKFLIRKEYVIECNWKVYVDNYLEGYHIPSVHPGLFRELDYSAYQVETHRYHSTQYAPLKKNPSTTAKYSGKEGDKNPLYYWVFPNFMLNIYSDQMHTSTVLPLAVDKTLTIFEWYLPSSTYAQGKSALADTIAFNDQVQKEDMIVCEAVQKGLRSAHYHSGRFSVKREAGVHHFHNLVHEFLSE